MRKLIKPLFILVFIIAHVFIIRNIILLSKDVLFGDLSGKDLIPFPRYGLVRIPNTPEAQQYQAQNRLEVDFAQVYFPSRQMDFLNENYRTGVLDPLQRPSRYAGLVHYLCAITICKFDYGIASLLHIAIQGLLFYLVFIISFKVLKIEKFILPGLLLANVYLFLTPAGLSWFERGQFSVYIGTGYLLLFMGFIKRNPSLVLLSILFAFIKWTSFPYILVVFCVYILNSKNLSEGKKAILLAVGCLFLVVFLCLLFPDQSINFLKGLYDQERFNTPGGISLTNFLPVWMVKIMPIPLIILGYWHVKINNQVIERTIPFMAGAAIIMLTYPTLAFEYNIPSLLGFIPLIFYWDKLPDNPINTPVREIIKYSFLVFVFCASFSSYIQTPRGAIVLSEYVLISAILFIGPLLYYWKVTRSPKRINEIPNS
jgi:hypothetical protein